MLSSKNPFFLFVLMFAFQQQSYAMERNEIIGFVTLHDRIVEKMITDLPDKPHWGEGQHHCFHVMAWAYARQKRDLIVDLEVQHPLGFKAYAPPKNFSGFLKARMPQSFIYEPVAFSTNDLKANEFSEIVIKNIIARIPVLAYFTEEKRIRIATIVGYKMAVEELDELLLLLVADNGEKQLQKIKAADFLARMDLSFWLPLSSGKLKSDATEAEVILNREFCEQLKRFNLIIFEKPKRLEIQFDQPAIKKSAPYCMVM